jgi:Holliday junction resolvasome RuvABC endonuclease subunit
MKVMGLDLSLSGTGAALVVDGVCGERWLLKTSSEATDMDRYEYVARTVVGIVFGQDSDAVVDLVAMEGVFASRNLLTFGRLTALSAIVQYALHRSQVPYVVLPPAAWRTAVFGPKSKVDKERVRAATFERLTEHLGDLDVVRADLNVVEAFLIALAAWRMETGVAPRPVVRKPRKAKDVA